MLTERLKALESFRVKRDEDAKEIMIAIIYGGRKCK